MGWEKKKEAGGRGRAGGDKSSLPPLPNQRIQAEPALLREVPLGKPPCPWPLPASCLQAAPRPGGSSPPGHSQSHPQEKEQRVPSRPSPQPKHANPNICKRRSPPWERRLDTEFTCPSNA